MKKLKILYGICGIGNGHTFRQLPIIEHFSRTAQIMIFAHDNSFDFYAKKFHGSKSVKVVRVAIPFYVGNKNGIDFDASAKLPMNQTDLFRINCEALARAKKEMGKPDLVISDYESVSAQYAYAQNVPLITIDQQSKYLCGDFPEQLGGFTFQDEIERLHMFFPKVHTRMAVSFFKVPLRNGGDKVQFFPSTIKESVIRMKRNPKGNSILVYISSAREFGQTSEEIVRICSKEKETEFHLFLGKEDVSSLQTTVNVHLYPHGDPSFDKILSECSGIISTAGHSLLSEAMYLGIPVYAIPVSPYEQHMNARVIDQAGFGITYRKINSKKLCVFIANLSVYQKRIQKDKKILLRGIGQEKMIRAIELVHR